MPKNGNKELKNDLQKIVERAMETYGYDLPEPTIFNDHEFFILKWEEIKFAAVIKVRYPTLIYKLNDMVEDQWTIVFLPEQILSSDPFDSIDLMRKHIKAKYILTESHIGLSPKETKVIHMIAGGFKSKAIAQRLNCAEHTISSHVDNILTKLNATNRSHAVAIATAKGIIILENVPWIKKIPIS